MIDPNDPSPRPLLDYHQAEESTKWSMLGAARWIGWGSFGLSVLLFVDPYLPRLHPLIFLPICGGAAGLLLALVGARQIEKRQVCVAAALPNLLALIIPGISMFVRFEWPHGGM